MGVYDRLVAIREKQRILETIQTELSLTFSMRREGMFSTIRSGFKSPYSWATNHAMNIDHKSVEYALRANPDIITLIEEFNKDLHTANQGNNRQPRA